MALEIRNNPAENAHENMHFRKIAKTLHDFFEDKGWDGLLIGNPICEIEAKFFPDAILYTPHSFIIIDLKDYEGFVELPEDDDFENGFWWLNNPGEEKVRIKGGSYKNPFRQLHQYRNIALRLINKLNLAHPIVSEYIDNTKIDNLVLFNRSITLNHVVSGKFDRFFNITDIDNLLGVITDRISKGISFSAEVANHIKSILLADPYVIDETTTYIEARKQIKESYDLWENQEEVISDVFKFLEDKEKRILILKGPEQSGKSFLVNPIQEKAFEIGIKQVETLAMSTRVAEGLNSAGDIKFFSMYATIYGGNALTNEHGGEESDKELLVTAEELSILEQEQKDESQETPKKKENNLEIIPIKNDFNIDDNALFIIDEAHLINDSFHQTTFMRFGSGHLLSDFLEFSDPENNQRKIIFIGDPYQITFGKNEKSALSIEAFDDLKDISNLLSIIHLKEKPKGVYERVVENYKVARQIDTNYFNKLYIQANQAIYFRKPEDIQQLLLKEGVKKINSLTEMNFTVLAYKNNRARDLNHSIRQEILGRKNELEEGDILLMDNNIYLPKTDPFGNTKKLVNGTYLWVNEVSEFKDIQIENVKVTLTFRQLKVNVLGKHEIHSIWVLMNYFRSESFELSRDETVALKIFFSMQMSIEKNENPFEKGFWYQELIRSAEYKRLSEEERVLQQLYDRGESVKGKLNTKQVEIRKLVSTIKKKYNREIELKVLYENPLVQAAYVRFGWAMTVHKSLGKRWSTVIFDTDRSGVGRFNLEYFQWLYTGISRAKDKIHLLNFESIDPLKNLNLVEATDIIKIQEVVESIELPTFKLKEADREFKEKHRVLKGAFNNVVNYAYTLSAKFKVEGYQITNILPKGYQVKIMLQKAESKAMVMFYFNAKEQVRKAKVDRYDKEELKLELNSIIESIEIVVPENKLTLSEVELPEDFRGDIYKQWFELFKEKNIVVSKIDSKPYLDMVHIAKGTDWLIFGINYKMKGFISRIVPLKASQAELWVIIVECIKKTMSND